MQRNIINSEVGLHTWGDGSIKTALRKSGVHVPNHILMPISQHAQTFVKVTAYFHKILQLASHVVRKE